jgi:hypothetical protein
MLSPGLYIEFLKGKYSWDRFICRAEKEINCYIKKDIVSISCGMKIGSVYTWLRVVSSGCLLY